jgi:hypothetical protein
MAKARLHPEVRRVLQAREDETDEELLRDSRRRVRTFCKPCWELKYCPYGPIVEDLPLPPPTRGQVRERIERERAMLATGEDEITGKRLTRKQRDAIVRDIAYWESRDLPEAFPQVVTDMACTNFGHICPVFWNAEYFTETTEIRRTGRYIPFRVKMRVARRDNYTCQHCGDHLKDGDIEFDHIIPVSKGGSAEEHNIRLTCFDCNRDKSNRVDL